MKNIVSFNSEKLHALLLSLKASRKEREQAAKWVAHNPETFINLLDWALQPQKSRLHQAAAWVLELVLLENIDRLQPYFNHFLDKLPQITSESSKRPMSKILFHYVRWQAQNNPLTTGQKKKIISLCFDWLLLPSKTATLAFAIKILIHFQKEYPWVKENLSDFAQNQIVNPSAGLRASLRSIFKK